MLNSRHHITIHSGMARTFGSLCHAGISLSRLLCHAMRCELSVQHLVFTILLPKYNVVSKETATDKSHSRMLIPRCEKKNAIFPRNLKSNMKTPPAV